MNRIHATCVAIGGRGILIRGDSGAGKSDLALRLMDGGALLVADDQVLLAPKGEALIASPPDMIAGLIEVRGVGIVAVPHLAEATVALVVDLVSPGDVERLPEPRTVAIEGTTLPAVTLAAFEASAAVKIRLLIGSLGRLPT